MRDRALINEVRKRVATLEGKYEMIAKDLESARDSSLCLNGNSSMTLAPEYHKHRLKFWGMLLLKYLPMVSVFIVKTSVMLLWKLRYTLVTMTTNVSSWLL